jgi:alpha-galactosidase
MRPIIDYAHELGVKIGVHMMRGIPRKAVELNTPIKGTGYTAAQIANKTSICSWCHHNYGIDVNKPGAQEYYNSAYKKLADWGIDFVKVDDLLPFPDEMVMIAKAIENSGRKMVYSLSPGSPANIRDLPYYRTANMVRITYDIWDRVSDFNTAFERWSEFQGMGTPGFWPDLDMIPFGKLQLMQPAKYASKVRDVRLAGHGNTRFCELNNEEMKTFITIRALAASPLMMGGDLPTIDNYSLELITDAEMLKCNQNGQTGVRTYKENGIEVWLTNKTGEFGQGWFGIFNRNEKAVVATLSVDDLKLNYLPNVGVNNTIFEVKDIWGKKEFVLDSFKNAFQLKANGVAFFKYKSFPK